MSSQMSMKGTWKDKPVTGLLGKSRTSDFWPEVELYWAIVAVMLHMEYYVLKELKLMQKVLKCIAGQGVYASMSLRMKVDYGLYKLQLQNLTA